jgi:pimeloyl-ACP methyl ester carboxylesterase
MERARRTWKIDPDRVYLCGHSMGGYGSWTLGAHHADQIAAIAPSAGAPTPFMDGSGKVTGISSGIVPNLRNVLVRIYLATGARGDPELAYSARIPLF